MLLSLDFGPERILLSLSPFLSEAVIYAFVIVGLGLTFPLHYIFCVQLFNMKLEEKGDSDLDSWCNLLAQK